MRIIHLWDAAASNSLYGIAEVVRGDQIQRIELGKGDFEKMLPKVEGLVAYV